MAGVATAVAATAGRVPVVGFVGLGALGGRMARRILDAGYDVVVHNRTPARAEALGRAGARVAGTPAEVAEAADIVCGCLLDGAAVEEVYLGERGLISAARRGQVFVEHGTFAPALAREVAERLAERGAAFLDAPVTGGPEGADAGTLTIMVGGPADALARAGGVLALYAGSLIHIGPAGAGLELKLVNQMLVSSHVAAAAEAAAVLRRRGLPLDLAYETLTSGWAGSAMLERCLARVLDGSLGESEATIAGLIEPQRLAAELADQAGIPLSLLPPVAALFRRARDDGHGRLDLAALVTTVEDTVLAPDH
jgi:3-hydroxyisobutyrate dehydrogenase-like beta-hydroxyacid dehydrogenase